MIKQYNLEENGTIWYEENGFRISFLTDPLNSDYQAYLKHLTEKVADSTEE